MSDQQQQQPRRHFPPHILRKTGELLTLFLEVIYADIAHNDEVCGVVARSLAVEHKAVWSQLGSEICPLVPIELLNAIDVYSARQTLLSAPELLALSPALRNSFVQFAAVLLEETDEEEEERQAMNGSETAERPSKQQQNNSGGWSVTSFAYKQALGRSLTTALQSSELHGLSTAGFQAVIDALNAIILRSLALAHFEFAPPKGTLLMRQLPNLWGELWAPVLRSAFLAAEQQCTAAWKQHQRQQQEAHLPSSPPQRPSTSALKKRRREEQEEGKVRNTSAEADRVIPKTFAEEVRSLFDTPRAPSAPPPLSIRRPLPPSANAPSTAKATTLVDARVTEILPEPRAAMSSKPSSSTTTAPSQPTTRRLLIAVHDSSDDAELRTVLQATDARATVALHPTHRADDDPGEGVPPPPPPTDDTSLMTCDLSTVAPDSQTSAVSIDASSVVGAGAAAIAPSAGGAALVLPLEERRPRVTIVEGPPAILNATGDAMEGGEHPHQPPVAESHSPTKEECTRPSATPTEGEELLSAEPLCRSLDAPVKARTYFLDPETKRFYPAVLRGFFA